MGTPTASIPAWMYKEHPEIVVTRLGGQYLYYGYRQNTDLSNPTYRFYCERVIRKILEHYKNNPRSSAIRLTMKLPRPARQTHDVQVGFR